MQRFSSITSILVTMRLAYLLIGLFETCLGFRFHNHALHMNIETPSHPNSMPESQRKNALDFSSKALALGGVVAININRPVVAQAVKIDGLITVEPLPYSFTSLEPYIDAKTMEIHHDRHYGTYVAKTNAAIKGGSLEGASLEDIMTDSYSPNNKNVALYNNAAQAYNHVFYWKSMTPSQGGGPPPSASRCLEAIVKSFGDYATFRKEFATAGLSLFGSGWVWTVYNKKTKNVEIVKTVGAENPMNTIGATVVPLFTMDVWEHAYYLKYQNRRNEYVDTYLDHLVNWSFAEQQLASV